WSKTNELVKQINLEEGVVYHFFDGAGLEKGIKVQPEWAKYIANNRQIIEGWIEYNLMIYLQRRNPNVPGIPNKLNAPSQRNLAKVIKYWKALSDVSKVVDIYTGKDIEKNEISIDHFIPWSYVAHDEMWNLIPTKKSTNSSKSNKLPVWEKFFKPLAMEEYSAYKAIWQNEALHKIFDSCAKEHINSDEVRHRLYRKGLQEEEFTHELERIIKPVYIAAENLGFSLWKI
ncbi:MAG: HNH endonuclease domain-containing protein, partial [Anaerovoracaceae bacterium]